MAPFEDLLDPADWEQLEVCRYQVVRQFRSKRNQVCLVRVSRTDGTAGELVVKRAGEQVVDLSREASLQALLHQRGLAVPRVLLAKPRCLVMQYITGETLVDYLEQVEREYPLCPETLQSAVRPLAQQLAAWLQRFYRITADSFGRAMIRGDVNLRNFLVRDGKIFGVDFEDARPGDMAEDAGRILAFALTYDPAFTPWKRAIVEELSLAFREVLQLAAEPLQRAMEAELQAIRERR